MKKIIILNAPPLAGKDTLASEMVKRHSWHHQEFKRKLFNLTKEIFCVTDEQWDALYTRESKEVSTPLLNGKSPRQALIFTSETMIKPNLGKDYFGLSAAKSLKTGVNIFSDGGFESELLPLIEAVGRDNILLCRIHRPGCSFIGDSRSYIYPQDLHYFDLYNTGTEAQMFEIFEATVLNWLDEEKDRNV